MNWYETDCNPDITEEMKDALESATAVLVPPVPEAVMIYPNCDPPSGRPIERVTVLLVIFVTAKDSGGANAGVILSAIVGFPVTLFANPFT
jgi:hypothetical protein